VYEPEDFDAAIALAASGALPLEKLITDVVPLERLADGLHEMEGGGSVMKVLVECAG
jgi:threonine dehydrogenase-like Zn-dependent dehydrogenase